MSEANKKFYRTKGGLCITFPNGWTVSLMLGETKLNPDSFKPTDNEDTLNLWAQNEDSGQVYPENPITDADPLAVLDFLAMVSRHNFVG